MQKFSIYPFLLASYAPLALLANNLYQVSPEIVLRPLFATMLVSLALYGVLFIILKRDIHKTAFITGILLIFFLTYGHIYTLLKNSQFESLSIGHHRILIPVYGILLMLSLVAALRHKDYAHATAPLNFIAIVLLLFPLYQIGAYYGGGLFPAKENITLPDGIKNNFTDGKLPDIYYIILDTHTSAYALQQDFGDYAIDITPFEEEMESMGFYVADCSRSNHGETGSSLISSLNLSYAHALNSEVKQNPEMGKYREQIQNSRVRLMLEQLGYTSIAFSTGYDWSAVRAADIFLEPTGIEASAESIRPFEGMYLETTAFLILTDAAASLMPRIASAVNSPHNGHIRTQQFILNKLPQIATMDAPTFTFAHILVPHVPYVFGPDGERLTDPGFFSGDKADAINDDYRLRGYTGQVQFIDREMLRISQAILEASDTPPIIIIQGDHGFRGENRYDILNMYYLPGDGSKKLYRDISPVNSFRLVFDTYFGTDYGLLPDKTFPLEKMPLSPIRAECK